MREDVLGKLLEVEKDARRIIAESESEAEQILADARAEAGRIVAEAREEGRHRAAEFLATHQQELERKKQARLDQERSHLPDVDSLPPEALQEAVQVIVRAVAHSEEPPQQP
jgi:V/A-type H+-transporting ATPase subunit G/H